MYREAIPPLTQPIMLYIASQLLWLSYLASKSVQIAAPEPIKLRVEPSRTALMLYFQVAKSQELFMIDSGNSESSVRANHFPGSSRDGSRSLDIKADRVDFGHITAKPSQLKLDQWSLNLAGILGTDFLNNIILLFDARNETAYVWDSRKTSTDAALQWTQQHLDATEGKHQNQNPWTDIRPFFNKSGVLLMKCAPGILWPALAVDTGSAMTSLNDDSIRQFPHAQVGTATTVTLSGTANFGLNVAANLPFLFQPSPIVSITETDKRFGVYGMIGLDILNSGRWLMDIRHHALHFQPYEPKNRSQISNAWVTIYTDGESYSASFALRGYAPHQEYRILKINGADPKSLLNIPAACPVSKEQFEKVSQQLTVLFSKTFSVTVDVGGKETTQEIAASR